MTDERFWLLISLKLSGEARPEELAELEAYLEQNPTKKFQADRVNTVWSAKNEVTETQKDAAFNRHMQRLSNHLSVPVLIYENNETTEVAEDYETKKSPVYKKLLWATGIAASLFVAWFFVFRSPVVVKEEESKRARNEISTPKGNKTKVQLPDGTEVWLNADSKITYNENFQGKLREVELTGEAFFDVVKDETRPFVIHTNVIDVKVLGTAFNVRSYANEKNTETSLIRGSVEVTVRHNPGIKYMLKPNDKLVIDNDKAKASETDFVANKKLEELRSQVAKMLRLKIEDNEVNAKETLWTENKLAFDSTSLGEISLMLERWFNVKVVVDERIKQEKYTGDFDDEDIKEVLDALKMIDRGFHYSYDKDKREVIIRP
ncbi:FecR family protein [Terrimonas alba]|uniref:FecR family protein n=1 Tax=Terrimonas alba TaxID=3349636 RepID=UPI0035F34A6A